MSRILTSCASGVSPVLSMVMARRRFVVFLAAFWILIMLMFSGAGNVDMTRLSVSGANRPGAPGTKAAPNGAGGGSNSSSLHVPANLTARPHIEYHGYKRPGYELPLANGIPMRIVALGASTTRGDSPEPGIDNNGFRRPIREKLMAIGNKVNFVGTSRLGNMTDNDIVAGPGVQVDRIHNMAKEAIPQYKPNLVLVNAGANDCFMHVDIDNFYKRYDSLIQYLLAASHRTTIVLGTLLPTTDKRFNGREDVFRVNPQIRRMAKIYQRQGLPVVLAELQGPDGVQDQNLASDGMHPGTAGYEMMATKMFEAIVEADARGFLQEPEPIHELPDDGEDDRKDEAYHKWTREKKKMDEEHERKEAEEMDRMEAELKKARAAL